MDITSFNVARLHPVLVHLPIGFLILTLLLDLLRKKFSGPGYEESIRIGLLASVVSSFLTVITGLMLAEQGSYDQSSLALHRGLGIATAILSLILYLGHTEKISLFKRLYSFLVPVTLVVVGVAGHFGGTLTHGPDYLFTAPIDTIKESEIPDGKVASGHVVEIKQFKFVPDLLEVKTGDTITFINKDFMAHDVTEEINKSWASGTLAAGDSWSMIAREDVDYFCSLHIVMKGKIRITN